MTAIALDRLVNWWAECEGRARVNARLGEASRITTVDDRCALFAADTDKANRTTDSDR